MICYETLKLNKEFRRMYGRGHSFVHPVLVTYIMPNRSNKVRIGITTGKKVGCAVRRNRARRAILAAFRQCLPHLNGGYDIVFVARSRTPDVQSNVVFAAMKQHFAKFGAYTENIINEKNSDSIS